MTNYNIKKTETQSHSLAVAMNWGESHVFHSLSLAATCSLQFAEEFMICSWGRQEFVPNLETYYCYDFGLHI